jgi:hypothetical protein
VHVVSQRARVLRLRRTEQPLAISAAAVLPSSYSEWSRHPDLRAFRSSIAPPTGASVYASRNTSRCSRQDSRSGWIRYFLSCRALASPTTCRFSPAHSGLPVTRTLATTRWIVLACLHRHLSRIAKESRYRAFGDFQQGHYRGKSPMRRSKSAKRASDRSASNWGSMASSVICVSRSAKAFSRFSKALAFSPRWA